MHVKRWFWCSSDFQLLLTSTLLSWVASTPAGSPSWQAPYDWHLSYLGVSNIIQAYLSQLCRMASLGLHAETALPTGWPWFSLTTEEGQSVALRQDQEAKAAKFCLLWLEPGPLPTLHFHILYIVGSFVLFLLLKLSSNSLSQLGSLAGRVFPWDQSLYSI